MNPAFVDQGLLGPDPDPGWPIKLDTFINIVRHADRYLALEEGTPPYEVSPELDTIGRFDFGGGLPLGMCAHPRIDPATGEMVVFRYDVTEPYLTWAVVGRDGSVTRPPAKVPGIAATITQVGEQASEFPRIDDRLTGRRHRYLTVGADNGPLSLPGPDWPFPSWRAALTRQRRCFTGRIFLASVGRTTPWLPGSLSWEYAPAITQDVLDTLDAWRCRCADR